MEPASTASPMTSSAPGSSGAIVTERSVPRAAVTRRLNSVRSGARRWAGVWAPHRAWERTAPSRCAPTTGPPSATRSATQPSCRSSASRGAVTRETSVRVVPWLRWKRTAAAIASLEAVASYPPPPWTCRSTKPGSSQLPARSTRSADGRTGGAPEPTAAMRAPSISTQPSSSTPASVTTRAPISNCSPLIAADRTEVTGRCAPTLPGGSAVRTICLHHSPDQSTTSPHTGLVHWSRLRGSSEGVHEEAHLRRRRRPGPTAALADRADDPAHHVDAERQRRHVRRDRQAGTAEFQQDATDHGRDGEQHAEDGNQDRGRRHPHRRRGRRAQDRQHQQGTDRLHRDCDGQSEQQ